MNLYYFVKKWCLESQPDSCRYALYRCDPTDNSYFPEGKRSMTLGQMLCHIDCPNLDNWKFVSQMSICDFTLTCYCYPRVGGKGKAENVKIIVLEPCSVNFPQIADTVQDIDKTKNDKGDFTMKEHQFSYNLSPQEFRTLYNLLLNAEGEQDVALQVSDQSGESSEYKAQQAETVRNLANRMRHDMDHWLLHYPSHAYVQWRMAQLRDFSDKINELFHSDEKEENGK